MPPNSINSSFPPPRFKSGVARPHSYFPSSVGSGNSRGERKLGCVVEEVDPQRVLKVAESRDFTRSDPREGGFFG